MGFFSIRSQRIPVLIPVEIYLQNRISDNKTETCLFGNIVKISKGGACVVVEKIILDGDHLFFTTQEKSENYLVVAGAEENVADLNALCKSIWMDGFTYKEKPSFKIGLQFLEEQKEFFNYCKKKLVKADNV